MSYTTIPPKAISAYYCLATTFYSGMQPVECFDTAGSLTGSWGGSWASASNQNTNQKLNVDLGTAKIINRLYIENQHDSGLQLGIGVKNVILYGTNSPVAFANITFATLTDLTEITSFQVAQHVAANTADPQYFTFSNATAYRYYVLRIADNWGTNAINAMGIRRIEFQIDDAVTQPPAAYVTHYPPAYTADYVKATSTYSTKYPYDSTNPAKSLLGSDGGNQWHANGASGSQKFNIDHGEAFVAARLYIENSHISGGNTDRGIKNILVYGTNSAIAFANVTYADTTDLTLLATLQIGRHIDFDLECPFYYDIVGNSTAFRYTVIRIVDSWGATYVGVRRIEVQSSVAPELQQVTLSLDQPCSLLSQLVSLSLDQPIALRKLLTLSLDQSCGMELAMSLVQRCRAMPQVTMSLNQWVRSLRRVTLSLDQHVGVCPLVRLSLDQRVRMPGRVTLSLDQAVVIAGQMLTLSLDQHIRMDRNGRVTLSLAQPCAIADGTALSQGVSLSVTVGGRAVDPDFVSIKADDSDGFMSATIRFPDFQQYLLCRVDEVVIITELLDNLPAEITVLQVKSLTNPEEPGAADHILTAISPTAALDEGPLTDDLGPGVAADLMTALVAGHGFTLDWQGVVGWPFKAGELMAEDETVYSVLVRLAAASGAFLQSLPDGATLRLRPEYAINVGDWPTVVCDLEINDQDHIFSIDEQADERDGFNAFLIGGQSAAAGNHRLDDTALTATTKNIRFYQWPFNPAVTIILGHTGGDWVSIDYLGVHEELIKDEEVVITAGIGQLQLPCYGLESYRYKEDAIGALTFEEDGSVATAEIGDALLEVTYRTKFRKWLLTDPRAEHLQIYIDEVI